MPTIMHVACDLHTSGAWVLGVGGPQNIENGMLDQGSTLLLDLEQNWVLKNRNRLAQGCDVSLVLLGFGCIIAVKPD